jgi:seryl-tRNA synthetase
VTDLSGEIKVFKTCAFGGFDRGDVMTYVRKLTQERNKYRATVESYSDDTAKRDGEIESLRRENEALKKELSDIRSAFDEASSHLREIIDSISPSPEKMTPDAGGVPPASS